VGDNVGGFFCVGCIEERGLAWGTTYSRKGGRDVGRGGGKSCGAGLMRVGDVVKKPRGTGVVPRAGNGGGGFRGAAECRWLGRERVCKF